jgi:hypothetical protein
MSATLIDLQERLADHLGSPTARPRLSCHWTPPPLRPPTPPLPHRPES